MTTRDTTPTDDEVRFSGEEVEVLRSIVAYWMQEQVVTPPYPAALAAVAEKLGIAHDTEARAPARAPRAARAAAAAAPLPFPERPLRPNLG